MHYNDITKERAYEIWTSYRNIHEVAALMRDQYPEKCKTLSHETIRNWRDRMGWGKHVSKNPSMKSGPTRAVKIAF